MVRIACIVRPWRPISFPTSGGAAGFVLETSDGEYRCRAAVFAPGMTEPWSPDTPGMDAVPHYVDTRPPESYAGKRLFIVAPAGPVHRILDFAGVTDRLAVVETVDEAHAVIRRG